MTAFSEQLRTRIDAARADLDAAHSDDDPFLVDVRVGELESLARLASDHGVSVDGVLEVLARYGIAPPHPA